MIRRAISALALTAVLAVPAVAQNPFMQVFNPQIGPGGDQYDNFTGQFAAPTPPGAAGVFQIFCVDHTNQFSNSTPNYDVWVTPMSSANTSHVYRPASAWAGYLDAARLASIMVGAEVPDLSASDVLRVQNAIWHTMGFAIANGAADYAWATGKSAYINAVIAPNQWLVISSKNSPRVQEFIYFDPTRPQETVPEPATMTLLATGLAGMAAAKRRRNKKS